MTVRDFVIEPRREIPLESEVDVAVVGGGTAGVMAATAAARAGARACLIERTGAVGGMVQFGMMGFFDQRFFHNLQGQATVAGAPLELVDALIRSGATPYGSLAEAVAGGRSICYRHEHAGREMLRLLRAAGVELWLQACFARAQAAPRAGYDLCFEAKGGRRAIRAKQVVDCTGEADVALSLGAAMREEKARNYSWGLLFEMGRVDVPVYREFLATCHPLCPEWTAWLAGYLGKSVEEVGNDAYWGEWLDGKQRAWPFRKELMRAVDAGDFELIRRLPENGLVRYGWDGFWPEPWYGADAVFANICMVTGLDPANPRHVTIAEAGAREYAFDFLKFFRKYLPGFGQAVIRAMSAQTVPRGGREIVGESQLTRGDFGGQPARADAICLGGLSGVGLPLGMFVPRGWRNLLVAGRCADQGYAVRASVSCMAAGYACGIVAALAAQRDVSPMELDVQERRRTLEQHGVLLSPGALAAGGNPAAGQDDAADGIRRKHKLS